ncbi:phage tail protein [Pseudomonas brassicacearum]|uniref:phage tail protein n=1 Tax=Pseudomonas brassicacearum TaxID=930166 RepID=UPI000F47AA2B|nr:phage tail protein [Pseudomonas brassicacearum]ROM71708.1 phage tail protein [Pseudomonas brassicacearum]
MKVIQELHQYEDGLRPPSPSLAHTWEDGKWVLNEENAAELLRQEAGRLCTNVDDAADSARRTLAGDPLRALEYQQAALEAQAFKDQGYPKKAVPLAVSAWVVKGRTARQAADQILAKAAEFEANLLALRELRLKAKAQIRAHVAQGKADLASQAADEVLATIRALSLRA